MQSSSMPRHTRESQRRHPSSKFSLFPLSAISSKLMELLLEKCSETFTRRISLNKWVTITLNSLSTLALKPRQEPSQHQPRNECYHSRSDDAQLSSSVFPLKYSTNHSLLSKPKLINFVI